MQMSNKRNVVLFLDKELVEKTRSLGFNLSKTFENHLKQLLTQFSTVNSANNNIQGLWWAGPDLDPNGFESTASISCDQHSLCLGARSAYVRRELARASLFTLWAQSVSGFLVLNE
jgi:hypothetical protein